jgi:hypothetical protein
LFNACCSNGGAGVYGYNAIASGNQRIGVWATITAPRLALGVVEWLLAVVFPPETSISCRGLENNNANYSGYFNGNHVIANGTKTASVGTSKGNQLLYVTELPEVWFEDVGGGQLVTEPRTSNWTTISGNDFCRPNPSSGFSCKKKEKATV